MVPLMKVIHGRELLGIRREIKHKIIKHRQKKSKSSILLAALLQSAPPSDIGADTSICITKPKSRSGLNEDWRHPEF